MGIGGSSVSGYQHPTLLKAGEGLGNDDESPQYRVAKNSL